jgi:hypothetical protein
MATLNDTARDLIGGPHIAILATPNRDGRPQSSVIFINREATVWRSALSRAG